MPKKGAFARTLLSGKFAQGIILIPCPLRTILIMKRGRKDTLTGGTGDVNPQILTITATQTGADVSTVVQQPLPIPRFPSSPGKNLVMEFLSVEYYDMITLVQTGNLCCTVTTNPAIQSSIKAAIQDPRLIDAWLKTITISTAVGITEKNVQYYSELTDHAGHGVLVASDNLYIGVYSATAGNVNDVILKLEYRWKEVTLAEYIGIVQSQQ